MGTELLVLVLVTHAVTLSLASNHWGCTEARWRTWKAKYDVPFSSDNEDRYRKGLWARNFAAVVEHNKQFLEGHSHFTMALNELAPQTPAEYAVRLGSKITVDRGRGFGRPTSDHTLDYRTLGYVTRVKNQGPCGSSWAFGAVGSVEGQHFKKTGQLVSLSEQNLIDCSTTQTYGCRGGLMGGAMQFIIMHGIHAEANYSYAAQRQGCLHNQDRVAARISSYVRLPTGDEDALAEALRKVGPISIAVDAGKLSFRLYSSGIYDDLSCSTTELNHAVLLVGYGFERGVHYWIIKNSWGTGWGEDGYMRMIRDGRNTCGIASSAMYPVL